jgi:addiction module HigA family antidote
MLKTHRKPTLPGQMLDELYLKPRHVTISAFAAAVGCSRKHVSNVIHGHARIEAELATKFAAVLGTSATLWINMQNAVDLWDALQKTKRWKPKKTFLAEAVQH